MNNGSLFVALLVLFSTTGPAASRAQQPITEAQVVAAALANPVNTSAASLGVQQQRRLLNGVASFDNLQVTLATDPYDPMELGVDQAFDFPTTYARRRSLQRATVGAAERALTVSEYEIKRRARESYLQLQFLSARATQLRFQDSLFQGISAAAGRSFDAGQISKLEYQFAENRYNNVHNQYTRALTELSAVQSQLKIFTGLKAPIIPENWTTDASLPAHDTSTSSNPSVALLQQEVVVSRDQLEVARAMALPGFVTGVGIGLEQEHRNRLIGVRAGITLPLFFGQTKARIDAAKIGVQLAEAQARAGAQSIAQQYAGAQASLLKEATSIRYFEETALPKASEIMTTARRLFEAGQLSYTEYLRAVAEAFDNNLAYLQTISDYRQAVINVQYLTGTL